MYERSVGHVARLLITVAVVVVMLASVLVVGGSPAAAQANQGQITIEVTVVGAPPTTDVSFQLSSVGDACGAPRTVAVGVGTTDIDALEFSETVVGSPLTILSTDFEATPVFNRYRDFAFTIEPASPFQVGQAATNPALVGVEYSVFGILDTDPTPSGFAAFDLRRDIAGAEFYTQGSSFSIEVAAAADLSDGLQVSELASFDFDGREIGTGRYHPAELILTPTGGSIQNSNNMGGVNPGNGMVVDVDFGEEYIVNLAPIAPATIAPAVECDWGLQLMSVEGYTTIQASPSYAAAIGETTFVELIQDDTDGDGAVDGLDNCPDDPNADQADVDQDDIGDVCDPLDDRDDDGDLVVAGNDPDDGDPCVPSDVTAACDTDGDAVSDGLDNCPDDPNADQADADQDDIGDVCDPLDGTVTCEGQIVTINMNLGASGVGTAGNDVILGTDLADVIDAGDGDDIVCAGDGDDVVDAGDGDDVVIGGDGDDKLFGRAGADNLSGGDGDDVVHGNRGDDMMTGDAGNDRMFGYANSDTISGGTGNDRLHGNFGDDTISGGEGDDRIFGYGDNDVLNGGPGNDLIGGNFGDDILNGGADNDTLYGSDGTDEVNGNIGDDQLAGNSGTDTLRGGQGNDSLDGGIDVDLCVGGPGNDTGLRCETSISIP